jgi:hypothetical protein
MSPIKHVKKIERPTMNIKVPMIYDNELEKLCGHKVLVSYIVPGNISKHLLDQNTKGLVTMLKSFLNIFKMGFAQEPGNVHNLFYPNLYFTNVCDFIPKKNGIPYWLRHVSGLINYLT